MSHIAAPFFTRQNDQAQSVDRSRSFSVNPTLEKVCGRGPGIPLDLDYMGGTWNGTLTVLPSSLITVSIQGFPPIRDGQRIFIAHLTHEGRERTLFLEGVTRAVSTHRESNFWDGTTEFVLDCFHQLFKSKGSCPNVLPTRSSQPPGTLKGRILDGGEPFPSQNSLRPEGPCDLQPDIPFDGVSRSSNASLIKSHPLLITKPNGQRIHAIHDAGNLFSPRMPMVILVPGYGETKREYLTLAYYLATNGFQVVRYDHTNHVGASDGDHFDFTLSSMKEDFQAVTRLAKRQWPTSPLIGVAASMGARAAVKAEAEESLVDHLVLLVGIVNVQRTVAAVHLEDVFARGASGHEPACANILGLNVGQQFLKDARQNHFVTLQDMLQDAQRIRVPVMIVSAGNDAWVAPEDLDAFQEALGDRARKRMVIQDALHRIQENPKLARHIYRKVVEYCRSACLNIHAQTLIQEPNRRLLGRQLRHEKQGHLPRQLPDVGAGFWKDYLEHFQTVGHCEDYLRLLDHAFHALGPIRAGQRILDAGCGNGTAGVFLFYHLANHFLTGVQSLHYVGIDMIAEALQRAKQMIGLAASPSQKTRHVPSHGMKAAFSQMDLQAPLPFPDACFDRIVSNLVLGYVKAPAAALKELYRVLAPGGRMVVTNLKPEGDFSGIYQRLVTQAQDAQERMQARELLNNYGKIRQAEREGRFQFYHHTQWSQILDSFGQPEAQIYPTFANQAYLIVIQKPEWRSSLTSSVEYECAA